MTNSLFSKSQLIRLRIRLLNKLIQLQTRALYSMPDGFIVTNHADAVMDINPAAEKMLGVAKADILGMRLGSVLKEWPSFTDLLQVGTEKQAVIQREGKYLDVNISGMDEKPGAVSGCIILLRDVTEQVSSNGQLKQPEKWTDVTALSDLRAFDAVGRSILQKSIGSHREISIIILEINQFQKIIASKGQNNAEEILRALAGRIRNSIRPRDIITRHGGDKFLILLPDTGDHEADRIAGRIRTSAASESFATLQGPVALTVNLGVASIFGEMELTIEDLISQADQSLYQAKTAGQNTPGKE